MKDTEFSSTSISLLPDFLYKIVVTCEEQICFSVRNVVNTTYVMLVTLFVC